ncbi:group 3 secretory phospholipase A2-like [Sitodiplosis mosellana]|uniref:group 3 secretory phospholipase A2-like n=1 Tax=Sitodiplosis mosellana TaxID=263140 RepID=UPI002443C267|nr:group 3 secretory phospholipase A2-like [Sitodiplosis mosellana]
MKMAKFIMIYFIPLICAVVSTEIVPGTKHCGKNILPVMTRDLSLWHGIDGCCAGHDQCPISVPPNGMDFSPDGRLILFHNVVSSYTLSACSCDQLFRQCLYKQGLLGGLTWSIFYGIMDGLCLNPNGPGFEHSLVRQKAHLDKFPGS